MTDDTNFAVIEQMISEGRFASALAVLETQRSLEHSDRTLFQLLYAELLLETGQSETAVRRARALLAVERLESRTAARAQQVLARASFYAGDVDSAVRYLNGAKSLCLESKLDADLAKIELAELSLFIGIRPLEISLATVPQLRRVLTRVADPHLIARLRLCVARAEVSQKSAIEAQKHLLSASELLSRYPNLWLEGLMWLDWSNVAGLLGDLDTSLLYAEKATSLAEQSGHFKTQIASIVNTSHILCWRGDFERAERLIEYALRCAGGNSHVRLAALDSLANVFISTGRYGECAKVFSDVEASGTDPKSRLHWDSLAETFSRARLAQAQRRWLDAYDELARGAALAETCGDILWSRRINLSQVRCLALLDRHEEAVDLLLRAVPSDTVDLETVARHHAALAAVHIDRGVAQRCLCRVFRVCDGMSNLALARDLTGGMETLLDENTSHKAGRAAKGATELDSAIVILDLAGHPHVLAREAFLATGEQNARGIDTRGWDEREALAAARNPQDVEAIAIGRHRDEAWQIVLRPRPDLEHRSTIAALRKLVATAVTLDRYRREEKQRAALWPAEALDSDAESVWASEQMAEVLNIARRIAPTPLSVLLTGETGTGKEILARAIHRASDRADRPFLPFNCSAVPRDMLESQLFGYRKGAFTGADAPFQGVIRSAVGGTLFLDEIAEVGPDLQPKLLRFIETHEIHPLGEPHPVKVDVRVIAATNANLEQLVSDGRFREDLFYRLNVVRLKLPPLRERREEIPPLVQHYLRKFGDEQRKGRLILGDETLEYLLLYAWPGNIRQLANEVRRMVALAEADSTLTPALLSPEIQASRRTIPAAAPAEPELRVRLDQPLPVAVEMLEQMMVRTALDRSRGRVEEAARLLGISRKGLFLKRRRWGLHQRQAS
jgi:DNA-binding NtrC family response regulator